MKPEDELLGACARQSFTDAHIAKVSDIVHNNKIDWQTIYVTAAQHGVAPLIFSNLRRCPSDDFDVPQAIMTQFQNSFLYNMAVKERKAQQIAEALDFFQQRGITVMFIKGMALDYLVYEHPYYTISEDIDIVLSVRSEELASKEKKEIANRFKNKHWISRNMTVTLWLPYMTYHRHQILRKLILIPRRDFGSGV